MPYFLAFVAALVLTSPFGAVEARAIDDTNGLVVEISIDVDRAFEAVLVRPFSPYEELPPTALNRIDENRWGGFVTFPTADNWQIVFDGFEIEGETVRSESVTLTDIGVDPVVVDGDPAPLPKRGIVASTWWLIGGIVLALGALGALAYWTFSPDPELIPAPDDASE